MGSFFLTSKKASATLIFLVISILVVSSGVIITNQIKKSNDDNIKGTGLVLLDTEQDNSQYSDSSDDRTKLFTFGDSGGKSSSKKSSGGGGGGSDLDSQTYNEPEILDNDEIVDDQTSENQTEMNYTEGINESELEDDFINSSREIFSRNGTTYIMRDGGEYVLSISSSTYYIEFYPSLPSSVCENERIDITVRGKAEVKYPSDCGAWIRIRIMEDDYLIEDETVADYSSWYFSTDCKNVYFKHTFENVDLSDWIIPDPGGNGEFYAKASGSGIVNDLSTPSYDVYAYRNGEPDECDCLSGPCCDLSSRPYTYKPYPSQPTGYTDYYYCSGLSSPVGTSYCAIYDYYCDGDDSTMHSYSDYVDTCGICEYCTSGDPTCNYYSSSTTCSSLQDCDYLNNYHITGIQGATSTSYCKYADYNDNYKYCNGAGSCSSLTCPLGSDTTTATAGTCKYISGCSGSTSGTVKNYASGTSCGTNKECDGFGICRVICTNKCSSGETRCSGNYKQICGNYDADNCLEWPSSTSGNGNEYCTYGCSNGQCNPEIACYNDSDCNDSNQYTEDICNDAATPQSSCSHLPIACIVDTDCGEEGPIGDPWCSNDDVWQEYINYTCHYPGEPDAYCTNLTTSNLTDPCGEDSYTDNYCSDDDVYQNFTDKGCSDGACFENTTAQFVLECGDVGCSDGKCNFECYEDNECDDSDPYTEDICNDAGTAQSSCSHLPITCLADTDCDDENEYTEDICNDAGTAQSSCSHLPITCLADNECGVNQYIENSFCQNDDVWQKYITYICRHPGASDSYCSDSTASKLKEKCLGGCIDGRCKIEVCKIVCNFGTCYEYCVWQ